LLKFKVKEVFGDCSSTDKISVYDVCDIAFVFRPNLLEKKYVNCAGMSRVFFSRCRLQNNGGQVQSPFEYSPCESFPSRMCFFVLEVKHNLERMLNDPKQFQVCQKMHSMKCSLECCYYFCFCMRGSTAVIVFLRRNHMEKLFDCDLSWSSSQRSSN
jgi:hypothetical protein